MKQSTHQDVRVQIVLFNLFDERSDKNERTISNLSSHVVWNFFLPPLTNPVVFPPGLLQLICKQTLYFVQLTCIAKVSIK